MSGYMSIAIAKALTIRRQQVARGPFGGTRGQKSPWFPPKDPTRRTRACCWQRFVARMSQAWVRMSLFYIAELDGEGIERLKRFEDNRDVKLEEMD